MLPVVVQMRYPYKLLWFVKENPLRHCTHRQGRCNKSDSSLCCSELADGADSLSAFIEDAKHVMHDFRACLPARSGGNSWWSMLMSQSQTGSCASSSSDVREDIQDSFGCTVGWCVCCASCVS